MKIVDVIEKDSDTAKNTLKNIIKRLQQIVSKFLEGVVQFAHDPVYKFLLWLELLVIPLQRHQFVDKLEFKKYQVVLNQIN